jgi:hypothetical protein
MQKVYILVLSIEIMMKNRWGRRRESNRKLEEKLQQLLARPPQLRTPADKIQRILDAKGLFTPAEMIFACRRIIVLSPHSDLKAELEARFMPILKKMSWGKMKDEEDRKRKDSGKGHM